jgi:PAS domain S-box-containing protein
MSGSKTKLNANVARQILDHLPTSIFVKDENLKFVYSNKANQRLMGFTLAQLLGHSDHDFYDTDIANGFEANDRKVLETGETVISEELVAPKGGAVIPALTRKALLTTSDGTRYLIGTNSDQSAIIKREEQYRALAETVPVGVMQIDDDGKISFANPLSMKLFDCDAASLTLDQVRKALGQEGEGFPGEPQRFECSVNVAGQARYMLVISSGWLDIAKGQGRSALVSLVDISENAELKRFNEEILRLNEELAQKMRQLKDAQDALVRKGRMEQLGQMIATVAHELRNPLAAVRTSAYLMERKVSGKGLGVESQLQRIANGVVRCDTIIGELLDVSRNRSLDCKMNDLDEWLEKIVVDECKKLPAVIEVSCELGLGGRKIPFDPGRLSRAVINLLNNAAEAMVGKGDESFRGQGEQPKIRVRTYQDEKHVMLEVSDNGPGISPENLEKVREPLFTTKLYGTGLGIAAIEQISMLHGGSLSIQSVYGEGANFVIRLPAEPAQGELPMGDMRGHVLDKNGEQVGYFGR